MNNEIRLSNESIISLAQAARRLPPSRMGRPTSPSTIWRWVRHGCRGLHGQIVHLEAVRIGGRWVTSAEAIERFSAALTSRDKSESDRTIGSSRTPAQRRRASDRAEEDLVKVGI